MNTSMMREGEGKAGGGGEGDLGCQAFEGCSDNIERMIGSRDLCPHVLDPCKLAYGRHSSVAPESMP